MHHAPAPHPVPRAGPRARTTSSARRCGPATRCARSGCSPLVAAVLVLMGGLIQINPIWLWGPYHPYVGDQRRPAGLVPRLADRRAAPDAEPRDRAFGHTLVPNPFFGGVLFPTVVFGLLYALPWIDRRFISPRPPSPPPARAPARQPATHRPRRRRADLVAVVFVAGSADRLFFQFGFGYEGAVWFFRALLSARPGSSCSCSPEDLSAPRARISHPLRGWNGRVVTRTRATALRPLRRVSRQRSRADAPDGSYVSAVVRSPLRDPFARDASRSPREEIEQRQHQREDAGQHQDQTDGLDRNTRHGGGDGVAQDRTHGDEKTELPMVMCLGLPGPAGIERKAGPRSTLLSSTALWSWALFMRERPLTPRLRASW